MTALIAPEEEAESRLPPELSPTGKLIYLYLMERGDASVEDLKAALRVPQIRLYPTLESLERRDLIERVGNEFTVPG